MNNKKRTDSRNYGFPPEFWAEEIAKMNAGWNRNFHNEFKSAYDWRQLAEDIRDESDGDMVSIMNVRSNGQITGLLRAPRGWNKLQQTGALKGCRVINTQSAAVNPYRYLHVTGIETITFEMV